MPDKHNPNKQKPIPGTEINPEIDPAEIPAFPVKPEEELDFIPDEELYEPPAYETPEPGEGPQLKCKNINNETHRKRGGV